MEARFRQHTLLLTYFVCILFMAFHANALCLNVTNKISKFVKKDCLNPTKTYVSAHHILSHHIVSKFNFQQTLTDS